ncbi:hypothetical protein LCGC14_0714820 [marine sediment metagenome]|uniref:Uncharacterized protein n=1 Tax=marine sediment metagenome TaxID=412755 RepID=A0A0F9QZH4_9ZZZZ
MAAILKMLVLVICLNTFLYLGTNYAMETTGSDQEGAARINGDLFDILLTNKGSLDIDFQNYTESLKTGENFSTGASWNLTSTEDCGKIIGGKEQCGLGTFPPQVKGGAGAETAGAFSFLDAMNMVYAGVKTMFNIAIMPLTLMTNNKLPPLFAILIGFPLAILQIVTLIVLIRGGGAT